MGKYSLEEVVVVVVAVLENLIVHDTISGWTCICGKISELSCDPFFIESRLLWTRAREISENIFLKKEARGEKGKRKRGRRGEKSNGQISGLNTVEMCGFPQK